MADLQSITCSNCGVEIPLTDAMTQGLRAGLQREFEAKASEREKEFERKEAATREELEKAMVAERKKLEAAAARRAEDAVGVQLRDLQETLGEREKKLREAQEGELAWRKEKRALEERQKEMELEVARKLDKERAGIVEEATRVATEEQRLRIGEKEKVIDDLRKQLEEARRKAEQGSMQLQGEILELDLEGRLTAGFPYDGIEPVAKGHRGADVAQRVRTNTGGDCGTILWEAKRTKNWSRDWTGKLKEDQREAKAEVAVLVTQAMPPEVESFGRVDGVWVCDYASAIPLAGALREGLVGIASARQSQAGKADKMEQLYDYLAGTEFRQRVEAVVETFITLKADLDKEKRAMARLWAQRDKQIEQAINHTAMLYGGVQGIVGQAALPEIKSLQLEPGEEEPGGGD